MAIRRALGDNCRLARTERPLRRYRHVINWGSTVLIADGDYKVYNHPACIAKAKDKLVAFNTLKDAGVSVPDFLTILPDSREGIWLARTTLTGSQGDGIVVIRDGDTVPPAPLYVKYIKKTKEYRLHVVDEEVIFIQEKRRRNDAEQDRDQRLIRNHDNGWVFAIQNVEVPNERVKTECVNAVKALGLTFGAVDVVIGRRDNIPYVLEVNTAPGIESPTLLEKYTEAFRKLIGE